MDLRRALQDQNAQDRPDGLSMDRLENNMAYLGNSTRGALLGSMPHQDMTPGLRDLKDVVRSVMETLEPNDLALELAEPR